MVSETVDFRQAQPVSIEGDDLIQPAALTGHLYLHLITVDRLRPAVP